MKNKQETCIIVIYPFTAKNSFNTPKYKLQAITIPVYVYVQYEMYYKLTYFLSRSFFYNLTIPMNDFPFSVLMTRPNSWTLM